MRPVTDDVRRWKLIGLGALGIIGIGASAAYLHPHKVRDRRQ
ncbi:DUF1515 family protein [Rhizobium sp. L9]|nr:DUF1515 family protein [Rhizobium sp. L9]